MRKLRWMWMTGSVLLPCMAVGCSSASDVGSSEQDETGWLGDTSFEVGATVRASVKVKADGEYANVATDEAIRYEVVDAQWKFAKNELQHHGYHLNQLADEIRVLGSHEEGDLVVVDYEADVDLIHPFRDRVPEFEDLDPKEFVVHLPEQPHGIFARAQESCADRSHGSGSPQEYNYYYYFEHDKSGCAEPMNDAKLSLTRVYDRVTAYPEYDRLLNPQPDGTRGFEAAILPNRGDYDPMSRFNVHKRMLENELGLKGEVSEDGLYWRYVWKQDGASMTVDLYDATKIPFTAQFRESLGKYQLVFYNGHSRYGTQQFFTDQKSFTDRYQIIMVHSCRSYAYYVNQVFRAKKTEADPTGWDLADVIGTGESSYPSDSPRTLRPLLEGLMTGLSAVERGEPDKAPDWLSIVKKMNDKTYGIMYGVAGVRTNTWNPTPAEPTN